MRVVNLALALAFAHLAAGNVFSVTLQAKSTLGLQLVPPGPDEDGLSVSDLRDGAVIKLGLVKPGDVLLSVNARPLKGTGFREAIGALQTATWPLRLSFRTGDGRTVVDGQAGGAPKPAAATEDSASVREKRVKAGWATLRLLQPAIVAGSHTVRLTTFSAPLKGCRPVQFLLAGLACSVEQAAEEIKLGPEQEYAVDAGEEEVEEAAVTAALAVADRGRCAFAHKALSVHGAGAGGMLLVDTADTGADRLPQLPRGPYKTEALETSGFLSAIATHKDGEILKQVLRAKQRVRGVILPEGDACADSIPGVTALEDAPKPVDPRRAPERTPVTYEVAVWVPGREESVKALRALFGAEEIPRDAMAVEFIGNGCPGDTISPTVRQKIAIARRGVCPFEEKAKMAQAAGAAAVVIVNNSPSPIRVGAQDPDAVYIPVLVIGSEEGEKVIEMAGGDDASASTGAVWRVLRGSGW